MILSIDRQALAQSLGNSRRLIRQLNTKIRNATKNIYRVEGAKFSKDLFEHTLPMTHGGKAGGEGRVIRDVNKIFRPVRSIPFAAYVHAKNWEGVKAYDFKFRNKRYREYVENHEYARLPYVLQRTTASESMAEAQSAINFADAPTKSTHARGREPLLPYTGKTTYTIYIRGKRAKQKINTYANLARYAVGKMAGGWRMAVGHLGGSTGGMPFNGKGLGSGRVERSGNVTILTVVNHFANFNGYADKSSQYANDFLNLQKSVRDEVKYLIYKSINELKMG